MNWADLVALILILGIVGLEIKRGLGFALFTAVGAFLSLKLALLWYAPVSRSARLLADAGPNQALVLALLFLLIFGVTQLVVYLVHPDTFLSMDPFDNLLGGVCGVVTAWAVTFVFFQVLSLWGAGDVVTASALAPEVTQFRTYNRILGAIRGLGSMRGNQGPE